MIRLLRENVTDLKGVLKQATELEHKLDFTSKFLDTLSKQTQQLEAVLMKSKWVDPHTIQQQLNDSHETWTKRTWAREVAQLHEELVSFIEQTLQCVKGMRDEWKDDGMLEQATQESNGVQDERRKFYLHEHQYYKAWNEFQNIHYQAIEETRAATWHAATSIAEYHHLNLPIPAPFLELENKYADLYGQIVMFKNSNMLKVFDCVKPDSPMDFVKPGFKGQMKDYPPDIMNSYWGRLRLSLLQAKEEKKHTDRNNYVPRVTPMPEDYRLPVHPNNQHIIKSGERGELKIDTLIDES